MVHFLFNWEMGNPLDSGWINVTSNGPLKNRLPVISRVLCYKKAFIYETVVNCSVILEWGFHELGLELDRLCDELGPAPEFSEDASEVSFEGELSVQKCYAFFFW